MVDMVMGNTIRQLIIEVKLGLGAGKVEYHSIIGCQQL